MVDKDELYFIVRCADWVWVVGTWSRLQSEEGGGRHQPQDYRARREVTGTSFFSRPCICQPQTISPFSWQTSPAYGGGLLKQAWSLHLRVWLSLPDSDLLASSSFHSPGSKGHLASNPVTERNTYLCRCYADSPTAVFSAGSGEGIEVLYFMCLAQALRAPHKQ